MKRVFILKGLDCPNCSAKIEKEVGALPGVESSVVNLMQQTLTVQSEKSADTIRRSLLEWRLCWRSFRRSSLAAAGLSGCAEVLCS